MKKFGLILITIIALYAVSVTFVSCNNNDDSERTILYDDLPQKAKVFLNVHFNDIADVYIGKDDEGYDVLLINGYDIYFDLDGNWMRVDGGTKAVPQSILNLLPKNIIDYAAQNYPNKTVVEVSVESYGYSIELGGQPDIELKFNKAGELI